MRVLVFLALATSACGPSESRDGKVLFEQSCARCHGLDGRGDPIQKERLGVPDMTSPAWQTARSDADIRNTIIDGSKSRKMPGFNDFYKPDQLEAITAHVRSLRR